MGLHLCVVLMVVYVWCGGVVPICFKWFGCVVFVDLVSLKFVWFVFGFIIVV